MARIAKEAMGTAKCANSLFGRAVVIEDKDKKGNVKATRDVCECHVARPTRFGFPCVRLDDFCACHVDAATNERTFAGLVVTGATVTA